VSFSLKLIFSASLSSCDVKNKHLWSTILKIYSANICKLFVDLLVFRLDFVSSFFLHKNLTRFDFLIFFFEKLINIMVKTSNDDR